MGCRCPIGPMTHAAPPAATGRAFPPTSEVGSHLSSSQKSEGVTPGSPRCDRTSVAITVVRAWSAVRLRRLAWRRPAPAPCRLCRTFSWNRRAASGLLPAAAVGHPTDFSPHLRDFSDNCCPSGGIPRDFSPCFLPLQCLLAGTEVPVPATEVGHLRHFSGYFQGLWSQYLPLKWVPPGTSVPYPRHFSGNSCHSSPLPKGLQSLVPPTSVPGAGTSVPVPATEVGYPRD
jgi:hypothetical protein